MSRFAVDPRWLVYLPPTMAPSRDRQRRKGARAPGRGVRLLPARRRGRGGLRGEAHGLARGGGGLPRRRRRPGDWFGVATRPAAIVYTRTGRPFFSDPRDRRRAARPAARGAERPACGTSSAPTGCCSTASLPWSAEGRGADPQPVRRRRRRRAGRAAAAPVAGGARGRGAEVAGAACGTSGAAREAPDHSSTPTGATAGRSSLDDLRLAPFQCWPARRAAYFDRDHGWHLEARDRLAAADPAVPATPHLVVDLARPGPRRRPSRGGRSSPAPAARAWW